VARLLCKRGTATPMRARAIGGESRTFLFRVDTKRHLFGLPADRLQIRCADHARGRSVLVPGFGMV